jgi:hypothetical protein
MSDGQDKKKERKAYRAPHLKKVTIRIDETILGGCKTAGFPAFNGVCSACSTTGIS